MLVNFRVKGHVEVLLGHEQRLHNERVWPSQCQNWQKKDQDLPAATPGVTLRISRAKCLNSRTGSRLF